MKAAILQLVSLSPVVDERLGQNFRVIRLPSAGSPALSDDDHRSIAGIVTSAPVGVPRPLVETLSNLQVISCRGVGLDKIDLDHARERGIQVAGTFGVLSECVADLAFGLLIDAARRITDSDRFVRAERWQAGPYPAAARVSGKRLGIVGLGQIGTMVAQRAAGFDMPVRYFGRRVRPGVPFAFEPSLLALAGWSDFLVTTVSGGPDTRHLISAEVLQALGPRGYLINVARGSVVDTGALIDALSTGKIAGAGLDVYDDEPAVPPALLAMDQVVLAPHVASNTRETREALNERTLANLQAYFTQGSVLTPAF